MPDAGFDPRGANVVLTGAGNGIGAALARALGERGARVVVADLDEAGATRVAGEIQAAGGEAFAVSGDAASDAGVTALVEAARARYGEIDAWFANAGVDRGSGLAASEADWDTSFQVNTMAHVRAARLLVPGWVERGRGRFVVTASAAGLLTMLGAPCYSVSKHGAVAFAEWLSATYRHNGVVVQALCPQGVQTRMLSAAGPYQELLSNDGALSPEQVATDVVAALAGDEFFILPHPQVADYYAMRASSPDRWINAMNRIAQQTETKEQR